MTNKLNLNIAGCALLILVVGTMAGASSERQKAVQILYQAYETSAAGDSVESSRLVESALALDPDLAIAHIVRAEFAMQGQDWITSKKHFEKGLSLLKGPNQPLSPSPAVEITSQEVRGDSLCFLGYVTIKLAQKASISGNRAAEQAYLEQAHKYLKAGLELDPGIEARELADSLLRMFR